MNTRGGIVLKFPNLSQAEILAISKALADTEYGFTGSELEVLLKQYDFADENPTMTKTYQQTFVTGKGQAYIIGKLKKEFGNED